MPALLLYGMSSIESASIRNLLECKKACSCATTHGPTKRIAITGGPGAGKTSFIELAKKSFCRHVAVLPEAASIVYSGGFPRTPEPSVIVAAQKSIWYVMRELEQLALSLNQFHTIICDRGSLDGVAYWPTYDADFFTTLHTDEARELARYDVVVHMRTPSPNEYEGMNAFRVESSQEAAILDQKTLDAWKNHPQHKIISGSENFMDKIQNVFHILNAHIPSCCA